MSCLMHIVGKLTLAPTTEGRPSENTVWSMGTKHVPVLSASHLDLLSSTDCDLCVCWGGRVIWGGICPSSCSGGDSTAARSCLEEVKLSSAAKETGGKQICGFTSCSSTVCQRALGRKVCLENQFSARSEKIKRISRKFFRVQWGKS